MNEAGVGGKLNEDVRFCGAGLTPSLKKKPEQGAWVIRTEWVVRSVLFGKDGKICL